MTAVAVRLGSEVDIEISAKEDGTLQSFETYYLANIGPYTVHGPTIVAASSRKVAYRIPNYLFNGYSVLTNDICGGAFRGYGNTQLSFGREILMERMAKKLGMDPIQFRLKTTSRWASASPDSTRLSQAAPSRRAPPRPPRSATKSTRRRALSGTRTYIRPGAPPSQPTAPAPPPGRA